jgi:hypothetical protein
MYYVVWGGICVVAKIESENDLWQMKDFVSRHNHTDLVVVSVPIRYDLQENSCVNRDLQMS